MSHKQVRIAQLIAPFGPGSLYTDRKGVPHVICGLDWWFHREDRSAAPVSCEMPGEFDVFEPRLARLLRVDALRSPAPFREVRYGVRRPKNAELHTPAHRFPTWYRHTKTGELRRFRLHQVRIDRPADGGRWQPVRFIAVCNSGHLSDFPWKEWCRCRCGQGEEKLHLIDLGGTDLSSVRVECQACGAGAGGSPRSLAGVTQCPNEGEQSALQRAGIACRGERPWLGVGAEEACGEALIGALINQTNLYFARTESAIYIPDLEPASGEVERLRAIFTGNQALLTRANMLRALGAIDDAVAIAKRSLGPEDAATTEDLRRALDGLLDPNSARFDGASSPASPEGELSSLRRAEFNVLRSPEEPLRLDELHIVPSEVPAELRSSIAKLHLVERLRETRAFYGFDRLTPRADRLSQMPTVAMRQLFRRPPTAPHPNWLPAVIVYGEGLYIELAESFIHEWRRGNEEWLRNRLSDQFIGRIAQQAQTLPPSPATREWAARYLLVHSLAHALINQMVFECGYSSASLRERLFVSEDAVAPMAGVLIYTSAGDAEGTLGGLVRLGRKERFGDVFRRAIERIAWCSADPICSEELGGQGSQLANLGACHACVLLPETSCETINHGLDRAMLVGTPTERNGGAFVGMLDYLVQLDHS